MNFAVIEVALPHLTVFSIENRLEKNVLSQQICVEAPESKIHLVKLFLDIKISFFSIEIVDRISEFSFFSED
jgi:hypothetical protein